jgi:hypothetical protein
MPTRSTIKLTALLAACGLAVAGLIATGDYGTPPAAAAAVSNVLRCGSVVDPAGYKNGPLTASLAVALLGGTRLTADTQLTAGVAGIPGGRPSLADASTLDTMAVELMGYSGSRLSADAQAFAVDELNYDPSGPVDPSYAQRLDADILGLQRDCPDGARLGQRWSKAR